MTTNNIGSLGVVNTYKDTLPGIVTDEKNTAEKLSNFSRFVAQEKPAETKSAVEEKSVKTKYVRIKDIEGATSDEWAKYIIDNRISNVNLVRCIKNLLAEAEKIDKIPIKDLSREDIKKRADYMGKLNVIFKELTDRAENDATVVFNELNNEKTLDTLFSLILKIKDKCNIAGYPYVSDTANQFTEWFGIKMADCINVRLVAHNKAVKENKAPDEKPYDIGMEYGRFVGALYREVIDKVSPGIPLKIILKNVTAKVGGEVSTPGGGSSSKLPPLPQLYPPLPPMTTSGTSDKPADGSGKISGSLSASVEIDVVRLIDSIVTELRNKKMGDILEEVKMDKPFISLNLTQDTIANFKSGFKEGVDQYLAACVEYI